MKYSRLDLSLWYQLQTFLKKKMKNFNNLYFCNQEKEICIKIKIQ